ncbi:methyltransferase FkbM family [Micromonospora sp. L5]|nr:methyltransferase FkbM family [Micromonospora sp. L5]
MVTGWTPQRLSRRARTDLASLWLRRRLRRGEPYRSAPVWATVAGADVETFNLDTLSYLVREIFVDGCYEMGDLGDRPTIVDVGANIGLASLYFRRRYPRASITAIEADPDVFALLDRNLRRNVVATHLTTHHLAAHGRGGSVALYRRAAKPGRLTTSVEAHRGGPEAVDVPARRLSELIPGPIDLLKVDIEGGEHGVIAELAEAGALVQVRRIVLEMHSSGDGDDRVQATLDHLRRCGFQLLMGDGASDLRGLGTGTAIVRAIR